MKLSEAIRLGSMMGPQTRGSFTIRRDKGTCALAAAQLAIGSKKIIDALDWPMLDKRRECPAVHSDCMVAFQDGMTAEIWLLIIHLNDWHRWTREAIADWIETIEASYSVPLIDADSARKEDATLDLTPVAAPTCVPSGQG